MCFCTINLKMILKILLLLITIALLSIKGKEEENDAFPNKKIAFLFLTKGPLPLEDVWREFFHWRTKPNQYSIYVHTHPDYHSPPTSFFHGKDIKDKVHVKWGGMSQVKAIQNLVTEALKDKENEYFCLMSETCIPLVPLPKWRRVMLAEKRSIINACPMDQGEMEISRWHKDLDTTPMKREYWRKSATWFALTRKHATMYAEDTQLQYKDWDRMNAIDEHFLPSLLAFYHQDNETTCTDGFVHVHWPSLIAAHPKTYGSDDINAELFMYLEKPVGDHPGFNMQCSGFEEICHFTARKFAPHTKYALLENLDLILSEDDFPYTGNPWDHHLEKLRISEDRTQYYLIENGQLRIVPDLETMKALHIPIQNNSASHLAESTSVLSAADKALYPMGAPFISLKDGQVLKLKKHSAIYYIQDGHRHHIPDFDTFLAMNLTDADIKIVSDADLGQIHLGTVLPSIHHQRHDHHDHHENHGGH